MSNQNVPQFGNLSAEAEKNRRDYFLRVFISSTFNNMQEERNSLIQNVVPRFRKLCKERGVEFAPIDLRWGITNEQANNNQTVGICLREIDRSRPYFIGLLAERYGWTPELKDICEPDLDEFEFLEEDVKKGLSMTEIEFQYAVLRKTCQMKAGFWICSNEKQSDENESSRNKLTSLKEKLFNREEYKKHFVAKYASPKDLGNQIMEVLKEWLDQYFPRKDPKTWLEQQNVAQNAFERRLRRTYVENRSDYQALDAFAESEDQALAVVGDSGLGKSSLLANWRDYYEQNHKNVRIVAHYVSASEYSDMPANIIRRLTELLDSNVTTDKDALPRNIGESAEKFRAAVETYLANSEKRLIFIVDGLNQLTQVDDAWSLQWLPPLPEGAKYVLSTTRQVDLLEAIENRGWKRYKLDELDSIRVKQIIKEYLAKRGKRLDDAQTNRILNFSLTTNPLVLKTLLDELCDFGVFEKFNAEIDDYVGAVDENDFFGKIFKRLEKSEQFIETEEKKRVEIVKKLALLIALSRFGLTENELCRVSGAPLKSVETFLGALDAHLVNSSGRYSFVHGNFRKAIERLYAEKIGDTRRLLIDKFMDSEVDEERRLQEVPFQYWKLKDWENLRLFLLDFKVLRKLYNETFNCDFCTYWNAATSRGVKEFNFASYLELDSPDPSSWSNLGYVANEYKDFS